jgi:hypothetical protein
MLEWARAHANPRPQVHTNGVKAHVERTP